jgi:hypothetical protein
MEFNKSGPGQKVELESVPLKFVEELDSRKHLVLLYDDPEYARKIEFQFIKKGLENEEHCIYATEEDPGFIMLAMINNGIAVSDYIQNNLLHIYQISDPIESSDLLHNARKNLERILADSKPPFKIVSRIVSDVSTVEGMSAELKLEHDFHKSFDGFDGTVICPYDITKIENNKIDKPIPRLFKNHHAAIYALKSRQGGVFYLQ